MGLLPRIVVSGGRVELACSATEGVVEIARADMDPPLPNQATSGMHSEFEQEIVILTGAEVVRRRTGMYFDVHDRDVAATLALQALCHAIDDAIDGRCTQIFLKIDGAEIDVCYDSGMPLEPDAQHPNWTAAQIFLTIHAACHSRKRHLEVGSEFCRIGIAVLNAVCSELTAEIRDGGKQLRLRFEQGELREEAPISATQEADETRLHFVLDPSILPDNRPGEDALRRALHDLHSRFPGLKIEMEYASASD